MFADIIVNVSAGAVDRPFTYRIPAGLEGKLRPGMRVEIPFGARTTSGYVIAVRERCELPAEKLREISGISEKGVSADSRGIALAAWMKEVYGCTMNQALKTVLPVRSKVKRGSTRVESVPRSELPERIPPTVLNEQQQAAVREILEERSKENRPVLLFGITGSGKTEVYMALIDRMIAEGKQTILLIPEIGLTYQNLRRFYARFGERIGVINSRQSAGEKYETVRKAEKGELDLVIGPRSALFTPFPELGLILIDEEHESAYHSDMTPRYNSSQVARQLMRLSGCSLVFGSATPSVDSYYNCEKGSYRLVKLTKRASSGSLLPKVSVIDLREELKAGNKSIFSRTLTEKVEERLARKEQVMLFLNRRGYAGFVSCRSCGKAVKCPHCDVSLTYHRGGTLQCHYCGYRIPFPDRCPACGSPYVAAFGVGTQKVETLVQKAFPQARVLRMDADTTSGKGGHSRILSAFRQEEADILVGTQMIVKGHDFPNVTLVGVLAADISLYASEYRAAERTFELLTQAVGRAGRSAKAGEAVIQTYMPEHYAVQAAAAQDYEAFYREEMSFRRMLQYPPAGRLLEITVTDSTAEGAEARAAGMKEKILQEFPEAGLIIAGPAESPLAKLKDSYRQSLLIKHSSAAQLAEVRRVGEAYAGESHAQFEIR